MRNAPPREFFALHEIVRAARNNLSHQVWDYLVGGAETETTLKRNRVALDAVGLRQRVLQDVSSVDCTGELLGRRLRLPLILAPVGSLESFDEGGGASASRAAAEFGVCHMQSSVSQPSLEDVAAAGNNMKIFQLYVRGDDAWVDEMVERAVAAGYDAFAITVDVMHYSRRERDIAKRFEKTWNRRSLNDQQFQAAFDWDRLARFKAKHDIPLFIKGIADVDDALRCLKLGVEGIYVSNHGGRQLDHGLGSIDVLPDIVDAVAGKAIVVVDGGIYRGTDLVKAIALGADAVGVGRLLGFGMAAGGAAGVVRMLELLEDEVKTCLGLLGVPSLAEMDRSMLRSAPLVTRPNLLSAFPLVDFPEPGY